MKRKQKRYTTETQILSDIEAAKELAAYCLDMAVRNDAVADDNYKAIEPLQERHAVARGKNKDELWSQICKAKKNAEDARKEAVKLSKRRNRIEQVKLPKLKNVLAAFRTGLLAGCTTDPSVVEE